MYKFNHKKKNYNHYFHKKSKGFYLQIIGSKYLAITIKIDKNVNVFILLLKKCKFHQNILNRHDCMGMCK